MLAAQTEKQKKCNLNESALLSNHVYCQASSQFNQKTDDCRQQTEKTLNNTSCDIYSLSNHNTTDCSKTKVDNAGSYLRRPFKGVKP
jgi:hypothetical protein